MRALFSIFLICFGLFSCVKTDPQTRSSTEQDTIYGNWELETIYQSGEDFIQVYKRVDVLQEQVAWVFEKGDIFKSWDFGDCGTPPVHFTLTKGEFELDKQILEFKIDHYYYHNQKYEILKLDETTLEVKLIQ
jgi:hypothetical protein